MVASMVPNKQSGVYMGVLNMMIVIPMLIETLTFGWIYRNLLGDDGTNAILVAGGLFLVAALAMLWVKPPSDAGARLTIVTAYNPDVYADEGVRAELLGIDVGRRALQRTVDHLNRSRVTSYDSLLIEGDPAVALLKAANDNPHNLIVVGNRGVGADDDQLLGYVPSQVVRYATSDVIVVQSDDTSSAVLDPR